MEEASQQYNKIAEAIAYINDNFKSQPNLDEVAKQVHLSPFHFQRLFTEWAGVSPKQFLQHISISYAKDILKNQQASLFDTAIETGLSGTGRLHDLFVKIEGMTPGEYKNGGENLSIAYSFTESPFGKILVANTEKGICHIAFAEREKTALADLKRCFPNARHIEERNAVQENAICIFNQDWSNNKQVMLHLRGTDFQLKVWESLLKIPMGKLTTYGEIAHSINNPKASRAVGTAIGSNPVAFLIPCHRVIQSTGTFGGYMWGPTRKAAIIGWEMARQETVSRRQGSGVRGYDLIQENLAIDNNFKTIV
ncbi:MAG: methylated-DNA--[protein]-cysteine S-methyltransferase [Chitinophagaceae bacterium]|jgi:AraC family transcriptional regulator of adaptative response/methylated-DNA-[protein]-cysteine methyltransferase